MEGLLKGSLKIGPLKSFLHRNRAAMSQEPVFQRRACEAHYVGSKDVVTDANACHFFGGGDGMPIRANYV